MLTRLGFFVLCSILLSACAVPKLTKDGSGVQLVDTREKDNCQYLGVVTGSFGLGSDGAEDAEGAMNEVRNKAAEKGGNALKVLNIDSNRNFTSVVGELLMCEFR